jgi:hypothetical protein
VVHVACSLFGVALVVFVLYYRNTIKTKFGFTKEVKVHFSGGSFGSSQDAESNYNSVVPVREGTYQIVQLPTRPTSYEATGAQNTVPSKPSVASQIVVPQFGSLANHGHTETDVDDDNFSDDSILLSDSSSSNNTSSSGYSLLDNDSTLSISVENLLDDAGLKPANAMTDGGTAGNKRRDVLESVSYTPGIEIESVYESLSESENERENEEENESASGFSELEISSASGSSEQQIGTNVC